MSPTAPASRIDSPTAADPMSLTRPIWRSIAGVTRSESFSIAVFRSSTTSSSTMTPMSANRFQGSCATTKASGTAITSVTTSSRMAASLRNAKRRPFQLLMVARSNRSMASICVHLIVADDRIGPELEAGLKEDAVIVGAPVDRLRARGNAQRVAAELRVLEGNDPSELVAPAGAVCRDRSGEIPDVAADAQPVAVGAVE